MVHAGRLFVVALATVIVTAIIVAAGVFWMDRPTVLTIAAGPDGSPEYRFATALSVLLEQNHAKARLNIRSADTPAQALGLFARRAADLAIVRTDAHIPAHARAVAVLERELVLILGKRTGKARPVLSFAGKKIAVLGDDTRNEAILRRILGQYGAAQPAEVQTVPASTPVDQLLSSPKADLVVAVVPYTQVAKSKIFEELAQRMHGYAVYEIGDAATLERKIPGLSAETIDAGLLSLDFHIPDEETATVGVQKVLVARDKVADPVIFDLMRVMFENKGELGVENSFATRIEPPDVDKDSFVAAHSAAVQFVDDDAKTFFDRYSDQFYFVTSIGGVVGSVVFALHRSRRRTKSCQAGSQIDSVIGLAEKVRMAKSEAEIVVVEEKLEDGLKKLLRKVEAGAVSSKGIEAFQLTYGHVVHAIATRRYQLDRSKDAVDDAAEQSASQSASHEDLQPAEGA